MALEQSQLHIIFLPFFAPGHMIPAVNMARIFAKQGVKSTIVTTPANMFFMAEKIKLDNQKLDLKIELLTVKFPNVEVGLPEGHESLDSISSPGLLPQFYKAVDLLQLPFENLLEKLNPNCLVADVFFTWANHTAKKYRVPCLVFHGSSYFSQCIISSLLRYQPYKTVSSDLETFVVPGNLPDEINLTKSMLSSFEKGEGPKSQIDMMDKMRETVQECYGVIMNSFYELEPAYADYYEKVLGIKHWHIGPFSLYFEGENEPYSMEARYSVDVSQCLEWLDHKEPTSVVYVCFGSISAVSEAQLHEVAVGLKASGYNFLLVVKDEKKDTFLSALVAQVEGQGFIIKGWAPQARILNHQSVGCFVTHCGWNSILEGVIAGVPMVTWPLFAEQFYNEKLVTSVLKIGVEVGAKKWLQRLDAEEILVGKVEIVKAVTSVMFGQPAMEMRKRVKELKDTARQARFEGGSSYLDLSALIGELKLYKN